MIFFQKKKYPGLKGAAIFWLSILFTMIPFRHPNADKYVCLPGLVCEPQEGWCQILEKIAEQYVYPYYMGKYVLVLGNESAVISTEFVFTGSSETYLWFGEDELTIWEQNRPYMPKIVLRLPYSMHADEMYKQLSKYLFFIQRNNLMIFAEPTVPVSRYFQPLSQLSRRFNGCLYIHGPCRLEAYYGPRATIFWAPCMPEGITPCLE